MRGVTVKTPENVAEAQQLRAQGWMLKEIAARFGVKTQTVHGWLHDPDGKRSRARRDSYRKPCPECGVLMDGSGGKNHGPQTCAACAVIWTPEAVIAAIRDWADEHGGVPPCSIDWHPSHPQGTAEQLAEYATGRWPSDRTVRAVFGSWNAGLIAAGFEPHRVMGRTPDLDTLIAQIRAGERVEDMAHRYGVVPEAIHQRFYYAGLRVSDFRAKRGKAAA